MRQVPPVLVVCLTPDQLAMLVQIVEVVTIPGKQAAMVVSIQQALADAKPPAGKPEDAPQG